MILLAKFSNTTRTMSILVSCTVNDTVCWTESVLSTGIVEIKLDDQVDKNYNIKFCFSGKENVADEFVAETAITIDSITANGIDISPILVRDAIYTHNTNGQTKTITTEYTDFIGFDGTIEFQIQTPIFKWLYRNYVW